jgi:hypothetical protein
MNIRPWCASDSEFNNRTYNGLDYFRATDVYSCHSMIDLRHKNQCIYSRVVIYLVTNSYGS